MSFSIFEAFQYRRKDTFIHSLDPRTKLFFAIVMSVLSIIFSEIVILTILLVTMVPLIAIARSLREWAKSIKGLMFLIAFIAIINIIFYTFSFAIAMIIRIVALMSAFSLFFLTVHPDELSQALIQLRIPFSFAFAMSMAIRYVPTIAREAQNIREAQMSRGLELEKGNFIQKIKNFIPIIIPLIVSSIRRAISIAESLESRGFGASKTRTYLFPLKMKPRDYAVILLLITVLVVSIVGKYIIGLPPFLLWSLPI